MRSVFWFIFTCVVAVVAPFRAGNGRTRVANAPMAPRRDQSLALFKCDQGRLLGRISDSMSSLAKTINSTVPGGVATVVTVPIVTAAAAVAIQNYLVVDKAAEKKPTLNRYQCSGCGFTIFPAKNREERFFSSSFTCPNCGAPKHKFVERH